MPKGGRALDVGKTAGVGGSPLAAQDGIGILCRTERARTGGRTLGLAEGLQHGTDLIELQGSNGLFGKAHDASFREKVS